MQVTLGRRGDYAVRAVLDLSRHHGRGLRKSREIAVEMDIPSQYLTQILGALVRAGLLQAAAGRSGGYRLTRPPGEITLLHVVEAVEGEVTMDRCVLRGGPCDGEDACPLHHEWGKAQQVVRAQLRKTTFARLSRTDAQIERGMLPPPAAPHARAHPRRGQRSPFGAEMPRRGAPGTHALGDHPLDQR